MENYLVFVLISLITVVSPGPGVVLTLTNTVRYGFANAIGGILGLVFGTFIVAGVSATSIGLLLQASSLAFTFMKLLGAAYLIYLGIKLWRAPSVKIELSGARRRNSWKQFSEGVLIQLTNPKAIFFFMSVFPQFIDYAGSQLKGQFLLLVVTYSLLVLLIHLVYSLLAKVARIWFSSNKGGRLVNRVSGATFMCFGVGLVGSSR